MVLVPLQSDKPDQTQDTKAGEGAAETDSVNPFADGNLLGVEVNTTKPISPEELAELNERMLQRKIKRRRIALLSKSLSTLLGGVLLMAVIIPCLMSTSETSDWWGKRAFCYAAIAAIACACSILFGLIKLMIYFTMKPADFAEMTEQEFNNMMKEGNSD